MILPINTTPDDFFRDFIRILNPVLKLRNREADMLEAFLKVYYTNRAHPRVNQLLFSSSTLRLIRESLGMTVASFNNHKFRLRKKEIFIGRQINPAITRAMPVNGKVQITFAVNIVAPKKNEQRTDNKEHKDTTLQQQSNSSSVPQRAL